MFYWGKFEQEILYMYFVVSNDISDSLCKIVVFGRNSGWLGWGMLYNQNFFIFRVILNDFVFEQLVVIRGYLLD